jgi:hypothetical protein
MDRPVCKTEHPELKGNPTLLASTATRLCPWVIGDAVNHIMWRCNLCGSNLAVLPELDAAARALNGGDDGQRNVPVPGSRGAPSF